MTTARQARGVAGVWAIAMAVPRGDNSKGRAVATGQPKRLDAGSFGGRQWAGPTNDLRLLHSQQKPGDIAKQDRAHEGSDSSRCYTDTGHRLPHRPQPLKCPTAAETPEHVHTFD